MRIVIAASIETASELYSLVNKLPHHRHLVVSKKKKKRKLINIAIKEDNNRDKNLRKSIHSKCGKSKNEQQKIEKVAEEHVRVYVRLFLSIWANDFMEKMFHWFCIFDDPENKSYHLNKY